MADESKKEAPSEQVGQSKGAKNNNIDEIKSSIEAVKADLRTEMYKESADSLKFALKVIVTLIGLAAALVIAMQFKNMGEYEKILGEARDSYKKITEEGIYVVQRIQDKGNEAIGQIERKSKEEIEKLKQQLLEQREIHNLWISFEGEEDSESAIKILDKLESKEPNNWRVYDERAYIYYKEAKYGKGKENPQKKEGLFLNAKSDYEKSYERHKGMSIIHLADICTELNDEEGCRKWLERGMTDNSLPSLTDVGAVPFIRHIDSKYSNLDWFKKIEWKENK